MSSIHYKLKSTLQYKTLTFDGLHISVDDLKRVICDKENIKVDSFDLILTNAHTKREYVSEELVPRNSSVLVQRIPRENALKLPKVQDTSTSGVVLRNTNISQDKNVGYIQSEEFAKMTEEQRLAHIKEVSYQKYQPSNYQKKPSAIMSGPPPPTYVCNRCYQSGHWFKNCPLLTTKKTTGIPMEELMETTKDDPLALLHPSGKYVVPIMHRQARQQRKQEKLPGTENVDEQKEIKKETAPSALSCSLCKNLLRDAVLTICCGDSFCAECAQQLVLDDKSDFCPGRGCSQKITADSLVPNNKMREAVQKYLFDSSSKNSLGTAMTAAGANKPDYTNTNSLLHKLFPDLAHQHPPQSMPHSSSPTPPQTQSIINQPFMVPLINTSVPPPPLPTMQPKPTMNLPPNSMFSTNLNVLLPSNNTFPNPMQTNYSALPQSLNTTDLTIDTSIPPPGGNSSINNNLDSPSSGSGKNSTSTSSSCSENEGKSTDFGNLWETILKRDKEHPVSTTFHMLNSLSPGLLLSNSKSNKPTPSVIAPVKGLEDALESFQTFLKKKDEERRNDRHYRNYDFNRSHYKKNDYFSSRYDDRSHRHSNHRSSDSSRRSRAVNSRKRPTRDSSREVDDRDREEEIERFIRDAEKIKQRVVLKKSKKEKKERRGKSIKRDKSKEKETENENNKTGLTENVNQKEDTATERIDGNLKKKSEDNLKEKLEDTNKEKIEDNVKESSNQINELKQKENNTELKKKYDLKEETKEKIKGNNKELEKDKHKNKNNNKKDNNKDQNLEIEQETKKFNDKERTKIKDKEKVYFKEKMRFKDKDKIIQKNKIQINLLSDRESHQEKKKNLLEKDKNQSIGSTNAKEKYQNSEEHLNCVKDQEVNTTKTKDKIDEKGKNYQIDIKLKTKYQEKEKCQDFDKEEFCELEKDKRLDKDKRQDETEERQIDKEKDLQTKKNYTQKDETKEKLLINNQEKENQKDKEKKKHKKEKKKEKEYRKNSKSKKSKKSKKKKDKDRSKKDKGYEIQKKSSRKRTHEKDEKEERRSHKRSKKNSIDMEC